MLRYRQGTRLGILVKPEDVRLLTSPDDLYTWRVLPEFDHPATHNIFEKQLSKHSISAYRHLYREIGQSIEAVLADKDAQHGHIAKKAKKVV